ncbi:MAG: 2-hydroxyacid dehydrogenase [Actinomycetota bacterium]|nr:2-hydroxyacid dehydrogenase [Actinomycetota bacterium]
MRVLLPHGEGPALLGDLPPEVELEIWDGTGAPPEPERVEFWVPPFLAPSAMAGSVEQMSTLSVVQLLSAGADAWVGRLPEPITLCDARGVHSSSTSEWAVTAMLAALREFPRFARAQAAGVWDHDTTDELAGKSILVIGVGAIGDALCRRLEPFDVELVRVARNPREGVYGVQQLPDLLPRADVVVLLVPLTDATRGMVDAAFLTCMADGALLVNAARGPIVDTDALVAELATGRLRAALDVTEPEPLPPDHPLWTVPGLLLTPHIAGSVRGLLPRAYDLVARQLWRYAEGEPLDNVVTDGY